MALIGSCNGLIAISNGQTAFRHPDDANEITIWNPNTGKHRIIPFLPLPIPNILKSDNIDSVALCAVFVHGFGFDPLSGDYKLLRISWLADIHYSFESHVRLFSLKTNSWKIIPSMPYALKYVQAMGIFVENSLHWVMTREIDESHPCLIVAFNLTLDIFNVVPLPEEVNSESFEINVVVLEGCLCMTLNYRNTEFEVWVMKEYGSTDSWCKLFTLMEPCFLVDLEIFRPLCYSSDGSKVLLEGIHVSTEGNNRNLIWYDLKSEQVSFVKGIPNFNGTIIWVGSFVPPSFPVDNSRKKENHTSKSKKRTRIH
ncbi:F-box protein interaction domain protein [Medicago truncatula]|uniref:F-box protein interaction domain protein n=1 Tax=Medicago truncatula TaxID=3880 RepID=G7IM35_MEDTR|nr:F-box protein interaction domain protein [Medicago truncatula]